MIEHREQGRASDAWTEAAEMERFRRREVWSMAAGRVILLGTVALGTLRAADSTGASPMLFGWLLVVSGLMEAVHAFHKRSWGGFLLHLMPCVAAFRSAAHCNASIGRWNRLDAFVRIVLYCCRTVSNNFRVLVQIPSLDLGGVRRIRFTPPRRGIQDEFTSAGAMGLRLLRRHFNDSARLVLNHVCAGSCLPA